VPKTDHPALGSHENKLLKGVMATAWSLTATPQASQFESSGWMHLLPQHSCCTQHGGFSHARAIAPVGTLQGHSLKPGQRMSVPGSRGQKHFSCPDSYCWLVMF